MAKKKLDWFKLDCQQDNKLDMVESEFGLTGFAIVVKLWQKIYGGEGYYCEWNDDVALVFAKRIGVGAGVVSEIVSACIRRGIFDDQMYKKHGILTSHGIQQRYYECTERRKSASIKSEHLLLCNTQKTDNVDISSKNAYIPNENAYISSTEKKREDKNRIEESREENTLLTAAEKQPLIRDYGRELVDLYERKLAYHIAEKRQGKHYQNDAATIRKWIEEDKASGKCPDKPKSYDIDELEQFVKGYVPHLSSGKGGDDK